MHQTIGVPSVETPASWTVATVVLVILALSFGAPWITIIALTMIAAELGGLRSVPAFATALAWVGFGTGGIAMGYVAERVGVRSTVIFGAVMICIGLALSTGGEAWQLYIGQGLFVGFFGVGGMNAPFYVYISRWFDRRRGSALALISSGAYVAGALWPPIFERAVAYVGWRQTMLYFGLLQVVVIVPLAAMFLRAPPELPLRVDAFGTLSAPKPPMCWRSASCFRPRKRTGAFRRSSCSAAVAWRSGDGLPARFTTTSGRMRRPLPPALPPTSSTWRSSACWCSVKGPGRIVSRFR